MKSGIYAIVHRESGKCYVGQAKVISKRRSQHYSDLRRGRHHSNYLQNSWDAFGEDAFDFVVLELCDTDLTQREQYWADRLDSVYNSRPAVDSNAGLRRSSESRARMAAANRGRVTSEETKQKLRSAFLGKKYGPETSEKHRRWHREVGHSAEARLKMSEAALRREAAKREAKLSRASADASRGGDTDGIQDLC